MINAVLQLASRLFYFCFESLKIYRGKNAFSVYSNAKYRNEKKPYTNKSKDFVFGEFSQPADTETIGEENRNLNFRKQQQQKKMYLYYMYVFSLLTPVIELNNLLRCTTLEFLITNDRNMVNISLFYVE